MHENVQDEVNQNLRAQGVISENEIVLRSGDLFVAMNVVTGAKRRILIPEGVLNEASARLLKG